MRWLEKIKMKREHAVLASLIALALTFLFHQFWVKPKSARLAEMQAKIALATTKITEGTILLSQMGNRAPAAEAAQTTQTLLDQYLSSNRKFSSIVSGIVSSSEENSFSLTRLSVEKSVKMGIYTQTLYQLDAESTFIAIGKFLEKLEDSPLLTEVESIDISRLGNEMRRCRASIKLFGYVGGAVK